VAAVAAVAAVADPVVVHGAQQSAVARVLKYQVRVLFATVIASARDNSAHSTTPSKRNKRGDRKGPGSINSSPRRMRFPSFTASLATPMRFVAQRILRTMTGKLEND